LRFLTRADLGREFEIACRIALAEWRSSRARSTRKWWRHSAVEPVLDEIRWRLIEHGYEREMYLRQVEPIDIWR